MYSELSTPALLSIPRNSVVLGKQEGDVRRQILPAAASRRVCRANNKCTFAHPATTFAPVKNDTRHTEKYRRNCKHAANAPHRLAQNRRQYHLCRTLARSSFARTQRPAGQRESVERSYEQKTHAVRDRPGWKPYPPRA